MGCRIYWHWRPRAACMHHLQPGCLHKRPIVVPPSTKFVHGAKSAQPSCSGPRHGARAAQAREQRVQHHCWRPLLLHLPGLDGAPGVTAWRTSSCAQPLSQLLCGIAVGYNRKPCCIPERQQHALKPYNTSQPLVSTYQSGHPTCFVQDPAAAVLKASYASCLTS